METTTGMSVPPIAITICTPNNQRTDGHDRKVRRYPRVTLWDCRNALNQTTTTNPVRL